MDEVENHGVIPGRRPRDYVGGTLPYEIVNDKGDWETDLPLNHPQSGPGGDRYNCITHGGVKQIANRMMFDIRTGRMPQTHIDWLKRKGYLVNGQIDFSRRFNSIRNGTVPGQGNWVYIVFDDFRQGSGLIPMSMLPEDPAMPNSQYYDKTAVTQAMVNLGAEFLTYFQLPYEWEGLDISNLQKQLKQMPLLVIIPGHAVCEVLNETDLFKYQDSYDPFIKEKPQNAISDALKVLVNYIIKQETRMLVFFQIKGLPTIWALQDGEWVGFADITALNKYVNSRNYVVVALDQAEFNKVKANPDIFKS